MEVASIIALIIFLYWREEQTAPEDESIDFDNT